MEKIKCFFKRVRNIIGPFGFVSSISAIFIIIATVLFIKAGYAHEKVGYMMLFVFFCANILGVLIISFLRERSEDEEEDENLTVDTLSKIDLPLIVCKSDGSIFWANKTFQDISDKTNAELRSTSLASIISYQPEVILNADKYPDGVDGTLGGRQYKVKGFKSANDSLVLLWYDRSEINELIERFNSERTLVASIMIDNLSDLIQFTDGNYREALSQIDKILNEWAESVGGFIKEYQRERYIFLFDAKHLNDFASKRFDILEKVREVTIGERRSPVTISMGISDPVGSLEDRLRSASAHLDTALQRGGDQVVVKIDEKVMFYGGITKTVQKRTKIRARIIAEQLTSYMSAASNVIIMGHKNADYDCFGACIAVGKIAKLCNIPAKIVINENDPNLNKCLEKARSMDDYRDIFIDKANAQDLIRSDTLLIIVDVNNIYQFEAPELFENSHKTIFLDHHRLASSFDDHEEVVLKYIDPSASSTCELLTEFLEHLFAEGENELTKGEAEFLYAGIALDTKKFTVNSGTKTFSAAMYLRDCGADPMNVNKELFATDLTELTVVSGFEHKLKIYRGITVISVNEKTDLTHDDDKFAAIAADKLLTLEGVSASFTLCMIDGKVRIKARSNGELNVQLVLEKLGGGGHFDQAATVLGGVTLEEACNMLKNAIDDVMNLKKQNLLPTESKSKA